MTTVYVATFFLIGSENIHTVGVFRNPNRAFHSLHNFVAFRYPEFVSNMTHFPVNELAHFAEELDEDEGWDHTFQRFLDRFIIPFMDSRFRTVWSINITPAVILY